MHTTTRAVRLMNIPMTSVPRIREKSGPGHIADRYLGEEVNGIRSMLSVYVMVQLFDSFQGPNLPPLSSIFESVNCSITRLQGADRLPRWFAERCRPEYSKPEKHTHIKQELSQERRLTMMNSARALDMKEDDLEYSPSKLSAILFLSSPYGVETRTGILLSTS